MTAEFMTLKKMSFLAAEIMGKDNVVLESESDLCLTGYAREKTS